MYCIIFRYNNKSKCINSISEVCLSFVVVLYIPLFILSILIYFILLYVNKVQQFFMGGVIWLNYNDYNLYGVIYF